MPTPPPVRRALPYVCLGLSLAAFGASARPSEAATVVNSIVSVKLVQTPKHPNTYEIELYSSSGFPMNDTGPTLSIGAKTFLISRGVPGPNLDYLIFSLTTTQFLSLHNGDPVTLYYSQDDAGSPTQDWNFGTLQTTLLPKQIITKATSK